MLDDIELFLLDMDGTVYHENFLIPGASEFFSKVTRCGKKYAFMTNNSSKSKADYLRKLKNLNIDANSNQIVSSVTVTINYLKKNYPQDINIYLVGTKSLKSELSDAGFKVVPTEYREHDVDVCLLGFDTELTYAKLQGLCHYVSHGIDYIATNCDLRCPIKDNRFIPDCGAIAKMVELATERTPEFLGKPEPDIVYTASEIFNVPVSKIMCVGDRLYTDIAVGINAGAKTALVLTGEAAKTDVAASEFTPTYIFQSIKEIANLF